MHTTVRLISAATVLALTAAFFVACSNSGTSENKDSTVAATVNGKNIMLAEVERQISQQAGGKQAQEMIGLGKDHVKAFSRSGPSSGRCHAWRPGSAACL